MTVLSIINDLRNKETFTSLDNQVAKFSREEMEMYAKLNNRGIKGEEALGFVLISSAIA